MRIINVLVKFKKKKFLNADIFFLAKNKKLNKKQKKTFKFLRHCCNSSFSPSLKKKEKNRFTKTSKKEKNSIW